jgi:hypothetical protein
MSAMDLSYVLQNNGFDELNDLDPHEALARVLGKVAIVNRSLEDMSPDDLGGQPFAGADLPRRLGEWLKQLGHAIKKIASEIGAATYSVTVGLTISIGVTMSVGGP